jgi:Cys-tRNA(Pro)/Cys-tRNA(Cys) deacylase
MTPAIRAAEKAGVSFEVREYRHNPRSEAYGLEAARALAVPCEYIFKTLIVKLDGQELAAALVPVDQTLDLKALASVVGAKRAEMAEVTEAERATGYTTGGISPLGQRKKLRTVIDVSVLTLDRVFVSAGRRGLELVLQPVDLIRLCYAETAPVARQGKIGQS